MPAVATYRPQGLTTAWRKILRNIPGYDPVATAPRGSWFDAEIAERFLDFFPSMLYHIEGDVYGKPFILEPCQQAIIANTFGWQIEDSHGRDVRRFREVFIYIPRKNGKSPLVAGLSLAILFCDGENGQQDYVAAADREQAGKLYRYAKGMVEMNRSLMRRCRIYGGNAAAGQAKSIVLPEDGSFLQVLSADASTKHGGTTHCAIVDELHTQPNRRLVDVLRTSTSSANRSQPLMVYITTADFDRPSICNEIYQYACDIRDNHRKNPTFLPVIYEAPPMRNGVALDYLDPKNYRSPRIWKLANPMLDVSVSRDYLEIESQRAFDIPGYLPTFLQLHLNVRVQQVSQWLNLTKWDLCRDHFTKEDFLGRECWGGLDLGATSDLTSLCLYFPSNSEDNAGQLLWWHWVCEEQVRVRQYQGDVTYQDWVNEDQMWTTEGDEIDYQTIRTHINALSQQYKIRELAADRLFQGAQLCQDLKADGLEIIEFGMGFYSMAAPTAEFERLINRGELRHNGDPVARWAAGNCLVRRDPAGNLKPDKEKSKDKIDPIVSALMALGRAMQRPRKKRSIYEERGFLSL